MGERRIRRQVACASCSCCSVPSITLAVLRRSSGRSAARRIWVSTCAGEVEQARLVVVVAQRKTNLCGARQAGTGLPGGRRGRQPATPITARLQAVGGAVPRRQHGPKLVLQQAAAQLGRLVGVGAQRAQQGTAGGGGGSGGMASMRARAGEAAGTQGFVSQLPPNSSASASISPPVGAHPARRRRVQLRLLRRHVAQHLFRSRAGPAQSGRVWGLPQACRCRRGASETRKQGSLQPKPAPAPAHLAHEVFAAGADAGPGLAAVQPPAVARVGAAGGIGGRQGDGLCTRVGEAGKLVV